MRLWAIGCGRPRSSSLSGELTPSGSSRIGGPGGWERGCFFDGEAGAACQRERGQPAAGVWSVSKTTKPIPSMKMKNPWVLVTALSLSPLAVVTALAGPAIVGDRPEPVSITSSSHPSGDHDRALLDALKTNPAPRRQGVGITSSSHPSGDSDRNFVPGIRLGSRLGKPGTWVSSSHPSGDHDGLNPARYSRIEPGCYVSERSAICPVQTGASRR